MTDSDCDILKMELTLRTLPRVLHKTQTVSCLRISLCHTRLFQNRVNEKSLVAARLSTKSDIVAKRTLFQMLPVVYWQTDRHMAGHSKFSNIKHRKEAQDSKKSALMGQYVKLAQSAVKMGGSTDPKLNPKLAQVIESAKKSSLGVETIKKLLERMKNKEYKDIMIEVCGPANSIFLVMVDATNQVSARTEVKAAMRKHPVKVSNSPSSLHLFKQQGILYVTPDPERPNLDLEEIAIECEAEDVTKETNEEGQEVIKFLCDPARLSEVKTMLEGRSLTVENFYEQYEPLAPVTPSEAEQKEIDSITEKLENMDSYVEMHTNIEA